MKRYIFAGLAAVLVGPDLHPRASPSATHPRTSMIEIVPLR